MTMISDAARGLVRRAGLAAIAAVAVTAASHQRAEALSLVSPAALPAAKYASEGMTIEVRGGHGGHHGGGFRGGGGFHGGGFRGGGMAFRGGGYRAAHIYRGGGYRAARIYRAAPIYRYGGGYRAYRHAYHRPYFRRHFHHRHHFHRRYYAPYYSYPLHVPGSLHLPRGLDLLGSAQDLPLPAADPALLRALRLVRRVSAEAKQAPERAPVFFISMS